MKKNKKQRASPRKSGLDLKCERRSRFSVFFSLYEEIFYRDFLIIANQNSGLNKSGKKAKIKDKKRLGNGSIPNRDKNTHGGIIK